MEFSRGGRVAFKTSAGAAETRRFLSISLTRSTTRRGAETLRSLYEKHAPGEKSFDCELYCAGREGFAGTRAILRFGVSAGAGAGCAFVSTTVIGPDGKV